MNVLRELHRVSRLAALTVLAVCLLAAGAFATPAAAQQRPATRAQLEQRLEDRFNEIVQQRVGLDDEEAARLVSVLGEYRSERIVLAAETRSLRVRVRGAVSAAGESPVDDTEAAAFLAELRDLTQREADLVIAEQDELAEFLSPGQIVLIYQLRNQMTERVQQLRNRARNRPPPS